MARPLLLIALPCADVTAVAPPAADDVSGSSVVNSPSVALMGPGTHALPVART